MKCLVVDVGGTSIKYGTIEKTEIVTRGERPTPYDGVDGFLQLLTELYHLYPAAELVAISIPGRVDSDRGVILTGGALGYIEGLNLKQLLEARIGVPVYVENDAKCAAMAELSSGSLKGCRNALVYLLGTGIGGGVIIDGRLYKGSHNFAGEFSYLNVSYDQLRQDQLSQWCAVPVLFQMIADKMNDAPALADGKQVFARIEAGNQLLAEVLDEYTKRIAVSLYSLQCLFDVEKIAIGGGISVQPLLLESIRKNVKAFYDSIQEDLPRAEIVRCHFGNDANLLGAADAARKFYKEVTDRVK